MDSNEINWIMLHYITLDIARQCTEVFERDKERMQRVEELVKKLDERFAK